MPVRIYEIAKQLGMESKSVLLKAKDLGIAAAKVPSSALDRITAEYLIEQLGGAVVQAARPTSPENFQSNHSSSRIESLEPRDQTQAPDISSVIKAEPSAQEAPLSKPTPSVLGAKVPDLAFTENKALEDPSKEIQISEPTIVHVYRLQGSSPELCASLPFATGSARKEAIFNREIAVLADREGHVLEFKECLRSNPKNGAPIENPSGIIAKAVAGMMNADGGSIILGVRDNGEILGVDREFRSLGQKPTAHGYEEFLTSTLSDALGAAGFRRVSIHRQLVLRLTIFCIAAKTAVEPVYVRRGAERLFYVRQNVRTTHLKGEDESAYIRERFSKRA